MHDKDPIKFIKNTSMVAKYNDDFVRLDRFYSGQLYVLGQEGLLLLLQCISLRDILPEKTCPITTSLLLCFSSCNFN